MKEMGGDIIITINFFYSKLIICLEEDYWLESIREDIKQLIT